MESETTKIVEDGTGGLEMFGQKKLNKEERKHLRENGIHTKAQFIEQLDFLKAERKEHPDQPYPCHDCIHIARKLGMWETT